MIPTYQCFPFDFGGNNDGSNNSTNTNDNGTGDGDDGVPNPNGPNDGEDDGSYTTIVDDSNPEQCDNPPPGDLNGDCVVDIKDCILSGNSPEFCECKANGGSDTDCANECGRLKALSDVPSIKSKLQTVQQDSGNHEKIFRIDINSNTGEYLPSPIIEDNNGSNHANISVHHQTTAVVHSHPTSVKYKMFSADDILKLVQIVQRIQDFGVSTVQYLNITQMVVYRENNTFGFFAIRFDDIQSIQVLLHVRNNKRKQREFKRRIKNAYQNDWNYSTYTDETTISKQQAHLYEVLEDYGLNMTIFEVNFNAEDWNIDSWDKVDKNDTTIKIPCT